MIRNSYQENFHQGDASGGECCRIRIKREEQTLSPNTQAKLNTMNKLTTERFDAQGCAVNIASGEITVKDETHRVELRYLDGTNILEAVCYYIEQRHWDRNAEDKQHKLLRAMARLDERIQAAKAEAKA